MALAEQINLVGEETYHCYQSDRGRDIFGNFHPFLTACYQPIDTVLIKYMALRPICQPQMPRTDISNEGSVPRGLTAREIVDIIDGLHNQLFCSSVIRTDVSIIQGLLPESQHGILVLEFLHRTIHIVCRFVEMRVLQEPEACLPAKKVFVPFQGHVRLHCTLSLLQNVNISTKTRIACIYVQLGRRYIPPHL